MNKSITVLAAALLAISASAFGQTLDEMDRIVEKITETV